MLQQILVTLGSIGAVGGIGWVAKVVIEKLVTRGLDQQFDRRLEDHKHSLGLITEQARYEYQRDLANFNLYAVKRHAAAESVYAKVRIGHGAITGLFGGRERLTFEEVNHREMEEYLVSRKVPEGKRDEILEGWDHDREAARQRLYPYLRTLEVSEAQNEFQDARNEVYLNELYLTDEEGRALDTLFERLADWLYIAKHPDHGLKRKYKEAELYEALSEVQEIIRAGLRGETAKPGPVEGTSVTKDTEG